MTPASGGTVRVLHVDDDASLADLTAQFLEREDDRFSVDTATDAAAAHEWDVRVTDSERGGARFELTDTGSLEGSTEQ